MTLDFWTLALCAKSPLLLRFLHSAYPDDNEDGEVEGPPKSTSNPFLQPAMSRLVGLLAMLLGGYVEQANSVVLGVDTFPTTPEKALLEKEKDLDSPKVVAFIPSDFPLVPLRMEGKVEKEPRSGGAQPPH